jgi:hypothetical protein
MRQEALLKRWSCNRLRNALAASLFVALAACSSPSGGLARPYIADPPLPAEQSGSPEIPRLVETDDAPLSDTAAGLLFIADFGGGYAQQEIADSMLLWKQRGHRIDAIVTAGDNVYPSGQESGFVSQVERPYAALGVPLIIALGNHDAANQGGVKLLRHFGMPNPPSAHRFGPVEILVLDSNRVDEYQARWLEEKLRTSDALLRIPVFHHPVFSCGPHGSTPEVGRLWRPVIEAGRPELVVNGHDHNYQRIIQQVGEASIVYAVTGGGGKELTGAGGACNLGSATPRRVESRHEFLSLEVRGDGRWLLRAVSANATVFDYFEGQPSPKDSA